MSNFSCLLVGPPGVGKTTAAMTAPKPILFLDTDNKLHKMANAQALLESGDVMQWPIKSPLSEMTLTQLARIDPRPGTKLTQKRPKGYEELASMIDDLVIDECFVNERKMATIVLDSYSSMWEHLKRLLLAANGITTMSPALYGTALTNFEILNNTLLRLPANIIFICHEKVDKDELTGKISYLPLIDGQMKDKIGKDFEEVYYMEKKVIQGKATYEMLTVGNSQKSCRTSRELPPRVEPNFEVIYG